MVWSLAIYLYTVTTDYSVCVIVIAGGKRVPIGNPLRKKTEQKEELKDK